MIIYISDHFIRIDHKNLLLIVVIYNIMQYLGKEGILPINSVIKITQNQHVNRTKQHLSRQFQDFKHKVEKFEIENTAVLRKIKKNCSVKRSNIPENKQTYNYQPIRHTINSGQTNRSEVNNQLRIKHRNSNAGYERQQSQTKYNEGRRSIIQDINDDFKLISSNADDWEQFVFPPIQYHKNEMSSFRQRSDQRNYFTTQISDDFERENTFESDIVETLDGTDYDQYQQTVFEESQNFHLKKMINLLENKCLQSEKHNQELCNYIKKKQFKQSKVNKRSSAETKPLINHIKCILDQLFYTMCEQFLVEKFFMIQRKVKQLDSKLKNVAFLVQGFKEDQIQSMRCRSSRTNRCRPASFCISQTSIGKRVSLGGYTCQNPKCMQESLRRQNALERLRSEIVATEKNLQLLQLEKKQQKKEKQSINTRLVQANIKIDYLTKKYEKQLLNNKEQLRNLENRYSKICQKLIQVQEEKTTTEYKLQSQQKFLINQNESLKSKLQENFNELVKKTQKLLKCQLEMKNLQKKIEEKQKQTFQATAKMCSIDYQNLFDEKKCEFQKSRNGCLEKQDSNVFPNQSNININFNESIFQFEKSRFQKSQDRSNKSIIGVADIQSKLLDSMDVGQQSPLALDPDKMFHQLFLQRQSQRKGQNLKNEIQKLRKINLKLDEQNKKILLDHQNTHQQLRDAQFEITMVRKQLQDLLKKHKVDTQKIMKLQKQLQIYNQKRILYRSSQTSQKQNDEMCLSNLKISQCSDTTGKIDASILKMRIKELEQEIKMMMFEEDKYLKNNNSNKVNELQNELQTKNQQLIIAIKNNDQLRQVIEQLNSQIKTYQDQRRGMIQDRPSLAFRNCKISTIDPDIARQSLSFRLSMDQSICIEEPMNTSFGSNISQIFKNEELIQNKFKQGKTSRRHQIRLFQKTSAYIKSLKEAIAKKQVRIKQLEKQVERIKRIYKNKTEEEQKDVISLQGDVQISFLSQPENFDDDIILKEYASIQMKNKKISSGSAVKRINAEKEYLVEQNKVLQNEIYYLRSEIEKNEDISRTMNFKNPEYKIQDDKINDDQKEVGIEKMDLQHFKEVLQNKSSKVDNFYDI